MKQAFLAGMVLMAALVITCEAATRYVSRDGHNQDPYTNWYMAATNLNSAITNDGDTIVVSNGFYYPSATIGVYKSITITGLYGAAQTVFDGGGQSLCGLTISVTTNAAVYGLTITNFYGGGVSVWSTVPVILANCIVAGNRAGVGGGIYCNGNLIVTNCVIRGNTATTAAAYAGGGVYVVGGACRVDDSVISYNLAITNSSVYGGGIIGCGGVLTMRNCTIANNSSGIAGGVCFAVAGSRLANSVIASNVALGAPNVGVAGGAYICAGSFMDNCLVSSNSSPSWRGGGVLLGGTMSNCTVANNFCMYGGAGVYLNAGSRLANSVIVSNTVVCFIDAVNGGGIYMAAGSFMDNCLVSCNSNASNRGGGIWSDGTIRNCTVVSNYSVQCGGLGGVGTSINSIVYFNRDSSAFPNWFWGQPTLSGFFTNCCTTPDPGGYTKGGFPQGVNCITNDPNMANMPANCRLLKGSRCINAGYYEAWLDTAVDLNGRPRIRQGMVDMGAYEYFPAGTLISFR